MIYSDITITKKGSALLAKLQANGAATNIKYIALGAGTDKLTDESIQLTDQRQMFQIEGAKQSEQDASKIEIKVSPNNIGLETGYAIREMGVYAEDPDDGDILYGVINTEDDAQEYDRFPAYNSESDYKEIIFYMQLLVANAENVTFDVSPESLRAQVEENTRDISALKNKAAGGIPPANMVKFNAAAGNGEVKLYITPPNDTVIDGQLICTVAGVKIMRKDTEYPNTEAAGIEVLDLPREDFELYKTEPFIDSGLTNDKQYYYTAFAYSDYGLFNRNPAQENRATATPKMYELYGFDIDPDDSNPATRVSYPADVDNAAWDPMTVNLTTGEFDLKQWNNAFFIKNPRPVMLKYDGTVDYELDHNDQTKKLDGTASDISNTSYGGNAMVEFPKIYFKRWEDDAGQHVRVSDMQIDSSYHCYQHMYDGEELDYIYLPMFEGSSISSKVRSIAGQTPMNTQTGSTEKAQIEANGTGWQFDDWMNAQMIEHLLYLVGKSTGLKETFGNGHYTGGSQASHLLQTGTLKNKGMFYGTNGNVAVKFFWLENYYGDRWDRKYGVFYNTSGHILVKLYPPYTIDGTNCIDTGLTITGTSGGYISKIKMTEYGGFPIVVSGSETTFFPHGCWYSTARLNFLIWGASCDGDRRVGPAFYVSSPFSASAWNIGPSLAYKYPKAA